MNKTWYPTKGIKYIVSSAEAGSGIVNIPYETVTPGTTTKSLLSNIQISTTAGVTKTGFKKTYVNTSGIVVIENDGTFAFVANDEIDLLGMWYV